MKNNFSPEADFEKDNLDIIENLRNINEEELSENFERKLYDKILTEKIIRRSLLKTIFYTLESAFNPVKPIRYLAYASILLGFLYVGYLFFSSEVSQKKEKNAFAQRNNSSQQSESDNGKHGKFSGRVKDYNNDSHLKDFYQKVLSDGFYLNPSIEDVKKALASEKFAKRILLYTSPIYNDSIKVVIDILAEQKQTPNVNSKVPL